MPFVTSFLNREENRLAYIRPTLPAVTSTMQATFLTGLPPSEHGVVGNMWYDRDYSEHRCWKQSNRLVNGQKLWERARDELGTDYTCAKVFWWNNMYSSADYQITPRPIYCADGKKVFDVQTWPMDLRKKMKRKLGDFPFPAFWGPASGIASSQWIAESAKWFEDQYAPNLNLVYLPHLDYNLQKLGPEDRSTDEDLLAIDKVVQDLTTHLESKGVSVSLLSEYGITPSKRAIHLNRIFRKQDWICFREELGREVIDLGNCQVFAIADHQVAHVYLNNPLLLDKTVQLLEKTAGVKEVLHGDARAAAGLDHERAGDIVVVAEPDAWFTYYYWKADRKAPDYARSVDIHRKPGYDPVELFVDPKIRFPKLKLASKLLRKKLGFRMLMDVIPLDATLVKGSHGAIPTDPEDHPVLIGPHKGFNHRDTLLATEVFHHLLAQCLGHD